MKLYLDLETRSRIDLKKCGMYRYAEDESTDVLCAAFKVDDFPTRIWIPHATTRWATVELGFERSPSNVLLMLILEADEVHAHNAGFERAIWHHIVHKRYGFPDIPIEKWRCTAAKAAAFALPRSLAGAGEALGLAQQKDSTGYKIMLKMCKPNRAGEWNENPADFEALCKYNIQDVEAEYAIDKALYDLSPAEQKVWFLDQKINDAGFKVDVPTAKHIISMVQEKEGKLLAEARSLAGGIDPRKIAKTREWLEQNGVVLDNLQKQTVLDALPGLTGDAKRFLQIRQEIGKSSVAKLDALVRMACSDDRLRGGFVYHQASPGRWAAKGFQPQNLPRDSYNADDVDTVATLTLPMAEALYDDIHFAASRCVRGMIIPKPGHVILNGDLNSIEARVLAWLAGEVKTLDVFRSGKDIYKATAAFIYRRAYETITKPERQIGKVSVLACGYQGWLGAFETMAKTYGVKVDEETAKEIILAWREANPNIVKFWTELMRCALQAVKTGKVFSYGRVKFGTRGRFLHVRLPSGRLLAYCDCVPATVTTKYGQQKEVIRYMGVDSKTGKWSAQYLYGGLLAENCTQAVARDVLAEAMLRLDAADFNITLHVHDEANAEEPEGEGLTERQALFHKLLIASPEWADGLPLGADVGIMRRYQK